MMGEDREALTNLKSRSHFGRSGCLRRCFSACVLLDGCATIANEQAWGELLLMFINFLGEPAHQCPLCRNALAVTCQDVYAWFFYS